MSLTVLSVAYSLATVGPDAVGGSEQILTALDAALTRGGHHSIVVACKGSSVEGTLVATPAPPHMLTDAARADAIRQHRAAISGAISRWSPDLIHLHGIDFHEYLPPAGIPVLATLHLPPSWYPDWIFGMDRPDTLLHCVSAAQQADCPPSWLLLPHIDNGVNLERRHGAVRRRRFALALGRICPEKGFHLALDAARQAGVPLVLAGQVYGYDDHLRYFEQEIRPRLGGGARFVGPVGVRAKQRLLSSARCLVVPSLAPETSSLVCMEALAAGTPVVALPSGALGSIVEQGRTGYLVNSVAEMADAIRATDRIDAEECRTAAAARFDQTRMTREYLARYEEIAAGARGDRSDATAESVTDKAAGRPADEAVAA